MNSAHNHRSSMVILSDAVGLMVLAPLVAAAVYWLAPADAHTFWGCLAFPTLAVAAVYLWHRDKYGQTFSSPTDWLGLAGGSILAGAISFALDVLIGLVFHNGGATLLETASKSRSPFGFFATLVICPGLTAIALAGSVRSLLGRTLD